MEKYCCFFMLYNLLAFNSVFFAEIYDKSQSRPMVCGAFAVIWMLGVLGCLLLFNRYTVKILSCMFLLINAGAFYFIKTYHVAIEEEMLNNVWQTNTMESLELLNATWLLYVLFLGALPCFFINRLVIKDTHFVKVRLKWLILTVIIPMMIIAPFSRDVFPFVREHRKLKYFLLPVNYISAVISTVKHKVRQNRKFQVIGENAVFQPYWKNEKKMLIVFVVGETARADRFSLNGYDRKTNQPLEQFQPQMVNYSQAYSCGTSTAVSVPCMFAKDTRQDFASGSQEYTENVLDVFAKNKYKVLWIENNSDCKAVCLRVAYERPCADRIGTCNDEVLVPSFKRYLQQLNDHAVVVLHQLGSHGPQYYKRYPQTHEFLTPTCRTERLQDCSAEELNNSYDNTIYYTSEILAKLIDELKNHEDKFNAMFLYVSDHGESLGEHGLYLHSAPYSVAPQEQKHVPFFIWSADQTWQALNIDKECMQNNASAPVSHDYIFHSLLGLGGISIKEYDPNLDLFAKCRK